MIQKGIIMVCLALVALGCSRYYAFDAYYDQRNWERAAEALANITETDTPQYKIRQYRLALRLVLLGDANAVSNLAVLVQGEEHTSWLKYQDFARLYLEFLRAMGTRQFDNTMAMGEPLSRFPEEFQPVASQILGLCHLVREDFEQAKVYLRQSYMNDPLLDTLYFLGLAHLMSGDYNAARGAWHQVLEARPGGVLEAMTYFQLGEILYQKGDFRGALDLYYAAVNLYPGSEIFVDRIAFCYLRLRKRRLSEKFRKIALRINEDHATAWFYLNFN